MSPAVPISRRDFIKVGSLAGAGLAIGFYLPSALKKMADPWTAPAGEFAPNAWLRINPQGIVTVTVAKSEMGQGVRTSLPMILAEELDADWASIRVEQAVADEMYGHMGTGGSTSVRTSWDTLRKAGATARQMLILAAAKEWGVNASECRTNDGKVVHRQSKRSMGYGELAEKASAIPIPENVTLKDPADFRFIGRRMPRLDTPEKVDGSAVFGIDVKIPSMAYASIERCPEFGGSLGRFNADKARAVPGVRSIVRISSGVAVVADSTWAAMKGREALEVEWTPGPAATLSSAAIHGMLNDGVRMPGAVAEESGNFDEAWGSTLHRVEATYEVPFLAHATMEPMNCVAHVHDGRCEVWAPTQSPQGAQQQAAAAAGVEPSSVTVHVTLLGGGFGRRLNSDFVGEAVETSVAIGGPVQVLWTREDDIRHDWYRPVSMHHLRGALDAGGKLVAFNHKIVAPSISQQRGHENDHTSMDHGAVEGATRMPYDVPNARIDYVMMNTSVPIGPWRAVFPTQNVFAMECFIDELAHAAGQDPLEFRLRMMGNAPRMKGALRLAAEKAGCGKPLPRGHFRGIACSPPAWFGSYAAEVAEVSLAADRTIRVHRVVCAIDCGQVVNPDTVEAQMESGIVYGLSAALRGEITIDNGRVVQGNFDDYPVLTIDEMPDVDVHIVKSTEPLGGIGEPPVPGIFPAVVNAVSAATGKRIRQLPMKV